MFARRLSVLLRNCTVEAVVRSQLSGTSCCRTVRQRRHCSSKRSGDKRADREKEVQDALEQPSGTIFYGADGTETLRIDPQTALDDTFDWEALERAAGLLDDGGHDDELAFAAIDNLPDDFDDLEIEMDFATGVIKTKLNADEGEEKTRVQKRARPDRRTMKVATASKVRQGDDSPDARNRRHAGDAVMAESLARSSRNLLPPLPVHPKNEEKPGMQRRLAMLEAEMERIATEVTYRSSDWTETGLEVDAVSLSKNMRDFTVYYSSMAQSPVGREVDQQRVFSEKELRQRVKAAEQSVRRAIARDMDLKYAPNVHFEGIADQSTTGVGHRAGLDILFDRIAQERKGQ